MEETATQYIETDGTAYEPWSWLPASTRTFILHIEAILRETGIPESKTPAEYGWYTRLDTQPVGGWTLPPLWVMVRYDTDSDWLVHRHIAELNEEVSKHGHRSGPNFEPMKMHRAFAVYRGVNKWA